MGKRAGHDADLDSDGFFFHQPDQMACLRPGAGTALGPDIVGQIQAANQPVAQKSVDLGAGNKVQHTGFAHPPVFLAGSENGHQVLYDIRGGAAVGQAFGQHLFQGIDEIVRCQQQRDRPGQYNDVFGAFLDLAQAFEKRHRRRYVFDADAQKRGNRYI